MRNNKISPLRSVMWFIDTISCDWFQWNGHFRPSVGHRSHIWPLALAHAEKKPLTLVQIFLGSFWHKWDRDAVELAVSCLSARDEHLHVPVRWVSRLLWFPPFSLSSSREYDKKEAEQSRIHWYRETHTPSLEQQNLEHFRWNSTTLRTHKRQSSLRIPYRCGILEMGESWESRISHPWCTALCGQNALVLGT